LIFLLDELGWMVASYSMISTRGNRLDDHASAKMSASKFASPEAQTRTPRQPEMLVTIWFTADTHFGHAGAMGRFKRPFRSVAAMNDTLVARWNETVGPEDEVWHLGDFALRTTSEQVGALLAGLHGRKHLITGNNDGPDAMRRPEWASVQAYAEIEVEGTTLVLCHYAFRTWNRMYKGAYNLHGHSHGQLAGMTRQVDVGVDVWDFRPVTLDTIKARRRRPARRTASSD
jgi:calcineurin-like phosphoesterase family protein